MLPRRPPPAFEPPTRTEPIELYLVSSNGCRHPVAVHQRGDFNDEQKLQGKARQETIPVSSRIAKFWTKNTSVAVPGATARDHLALERTYLSYLRTSLTLSLISVVIAQLQILQRAPNPDSKFGFHVAGKPLAAMLLVCSITTSILGLVRWHHWQRTLLRGSAISGGWELSMVGALVFFVLVMLFGVALALNIKKGYFTRGN